MNIKIFRISSLRVIDADKLLDTMSQSQKQVALEKYQDKMSQYFVEVTYKNGMYVVSDNIDYYYACVELKVPIINVGINVEEIDHIKNHLLHRSKNEILNPMIAALIFQELSEVAKLGQKDISVIIGKSQGAISNKKRLLKLPSFVQNELIMGTIRERHGRSILQLAKLEGYHEAALEILNKILKDELNVSAASELIDERLGKPKKAKTSGLSIKHVDDINNLKNPESKMIIRYLQGELKKTYGSINKNFPNLNLEFEEGLDGDDFVFLVKMKGINR